MRRSSSWRRSPSKGSGRTASRYLDAKDVQRRLAEMLAERGLEIAEERQR